VGLFVFGSGSGEPVVTIVSFGRCSWMWRRATTLRPR